MFFRNCDFRGNRTLNATLSQKSIVSPFKSTMEPQDPSSRSADQPDQVASSYGSSGSSVPLAVLQASGGAPIPPAPLRVERMPSDTVADMGTHASYHVPAENSESLATALISTARTSDAVICHTAFAPLDDEASADDPSSSRVAKTESKMISTS